MRKIILLLFACNFFASLYAQENNAFKLTYNHLALAVKDLQRSADFYGKVLGLEEITNRTKMEGIRWFSFGEGKELHLISILPGEVKTTKAVHFALATPLLDDFVKYLQATNMTYSDWPGKIKTVNMRDDGIKQIYLQDPDGYWMEVNNVLESK